MELDSRLRGNDKSESPDYSKYFMVNELQQVLRERNVLTHENSGVTICRVSDQGVGLDLAEDILVKIVDKRTVLYLSGGSTPKELYKNLAKEEKLMPGAVGLVDERVGARFHGNSNERMIRDTGLLRYFEMRDIPFYPILNGEMSREETAVGYDEKLRSLQSVFFKHVGILGIGADGHTAGLPVRSEKRKEQSKKKNRVRDMNLVEEVDYFPGSQKERVTMSFLGLSMIDVLLVLVFGEGKRGALDLVFSEGSEEDVPGRFYKRPEIANRTLLITDQQI